MHTEYTSLTGSRDFRLLLHPLFFKFSALYTKTRRINLIFHNPNAFKRIKVSVKDVMKPYLVFMAVNIITLVSWTAIAPLTYQRFDYPGTDDWNRVIATYGACVTVSEEGERNTTYAPFLVIITTVNMGLLFLANVHAYRARSIQTEYSESKASATTRNASITCVFCSTLWIN